MKTVLGISTCLALVTGMSAQGWYNHLSLWAERSGWTLVHSVWHLAIVAIVAILLDRLLMPQRRSVGHPTQSWIPGTALLFVLGTLAFLWSTLQSNQSVAQQSGVSTSTEPLTGIVLQEDGSPAVGATVNAAAVFLPQRITTTTDDYGKFRIELPRRLDEHFGSDEFLPYVLAIRWKTFGADIEEALDENGKSVSIEGQPLPLQTIRLKPGCRLHGKLLRQEDDRPIDGARLFLATGEVLTTNIHGAFEIAGFPMQPNSLVAVVPGRAREYIAFDTTLQPDAALEIRLHYGKLLKGRVRDEQGNPIRGAFLARKQRSASSLPFNGLDVPCRDDGSFEYELSSADTIQTLFATAPGSDPERFTVSVDSSLEVIERDVTLRKSGTAEIEKQQNSERRTITGIVRGATGAPIQGATIRNGNSCQPRVEASSDLHGRFSITPMGRLDSLVAIAPGHVPQMLVMDLKTRASFDLPVGVEAHGVVVDTAGNPIPGVRVTTILSAGTSHSNLWNTRIDERRTATNSQGEFRIAHVLPEIMTFSFQKEGYSEQRDITLTADGSVNTIRLCSRGMVLGKVIDANGRRVRNFKVRTTYPRPWPSKSEGPSANFSEENAIHFTRDDGTFVLSGFDANAWLRLVVSSPGIGFATVDSVQTKPLDDPAKPEDLTIRLKPFVPLVVRVEEASSSKAISGATVRLFDHTVDMKGYGPCHWDDEDSFVAQSVTNDMGEVQFVDQEFGSGVLALTAPGFGQRRVPWMPGEQTVKISLDAEARVEGQIVSNGKPFVKGTAELRSEHHEFNLDLAKTNGILKFNRIPAGEYNLWIRGDVHVLMSRHLKMAAGTTRSVTLNIPMVKVDFDEGSSDSHSMGKKISFQIVDTAGQPAVGATVKTTQVWGNGSRQFAINGKHFPPDEEVFLPAITDSDGIATIEFPDHEVLAHAGYSAERVESIRETLQQSSLHFRLRIEHSDHPVWEDSTFAGRPDPIVLADSTEIIVRAHRGQDPAMATRLYANRRFWNDSAFTDVDGILTLRNIDISSEDALRYLRIVQVPKEGPAWFSDLIDLRNQQGRQVSLEVTLSPGVRLEGGLSENVPRPIQNGRVVARIKKGDPRTGWHWMATTEIAPDGTFNFESLPRNEHAQLTVLCDGWISLCPTVDEMQAYCQEHDFEAPEYADRLTRRRGSVFPRLVPLNQPVTHAVIPMGRTSVAEVLVVDESNKPIENAWVGFSPNQIDFNNGAGILGDGFDQLSLIRQQLDSGKPSTDEAPWANWTRDRYFAKTDARGIAMITDIPAGTVSKDENPIEYLFGVSHDDYVVAKPAVPNREHYRDSAKIELLAGQRGTVTVTMKRR